MKQKINIRIIVLVGITFLVGFFRILQTTGHTPMSNFTPIGAMALFGGSYFLQNSRAYLFPLLTLFISDIVLMQTVYDGYGNGFLYEGWLWTYVAFGLMVFLGRNIIRKINVKNILLGGFLAGLAHFIIVDFGVWLGGGLDVTTGLPYTRDAAGLLKCYTLAIPFFKNMLAGNLIYGAILFGGYELAQLRFPVLRPAGL